MGIAEKIPTLEHAAKRSRKIPEYLIWEIMDGQPLYRRGYKDVLRKLKTVEEIAGTSSYQALISQYLNALLLQQMDLERYDVLSQEIGVHLRRRDNLSHDIAVYPFLSADKISKKYTDYPAKIAIEIDIDIDPSVMKDIEYLNRKTQKLLDFGVEKVIWVLTNIRKVLIATPNAAWLMVDWTQDVEILEGITFNIHTYLTKRGIDI